MWQAAHSLTFCSMQWGDSIYRAWWAKSGHFRSRGTSRTEWSSQRTLKHSIYSRLFFLARAPFLLKLVYETLCCCTIQLYDWTTPFFHRLLPLLSPVDFGPQPTVQPTKSVTIATTVQQQESQRSTMKKGVGGVISTKGGWSLTSSYQYKHHKLQTEYVYTLLLPMMFTNVHYT